LNFKEGYIVVVGFRSFVVVIEIVGRHSDVNAPAVAAAVLNSQDFNFHLEKYGR
jgi:hypothetical protein